jgi:hypothetical protein
VQHVVPAEDVIVHQEKGEAFLLHVASGRYFGLNRSGLVVWNAIVEGVDPAAALRARWPNADPATADADSARLIEVLLRAGLVTPRSVNDPEP